MKKEIKKRWLEALRSGKYEQGKAYLNKDGKLCCLGVLCELAAEEGVVERYEGIDPYDKLPLVAYGTGERLPSVTVQEWAGLPDDYYEAYHVPTKKYEGRTLYTMNDTGSSFEEIANVIERRL